MPRPQSNPMQPLAMVDGVLRFAENRIVRDLMDMAAEHGFNLNNIVLGQQMGAYTIDELAQFHQLTGYSVSGYGDLNLPRKYVKAADEEADRFREKKAREK